MAAVMRLSDSVLVLDQGRVLMSGSPDEVTKDPRVIEAYLGEEPTDAAS
jgi:branched-chain amino acid transport system ATP-binding protein